MSQLAAANRSVIGEAFIADVDDEYEAAQRISAAAEHFLPLIGDSLEYVLQVHLREQIRHDAYAGGGARGGDRAEVVDRLLRRHGRLHAARRDACAG